VERQDPEEWIAELTKRLEEEKALVERLENENEVWEKRYNGLLMDDKKGSEDLKCVKREKEKTNRVKEFEEKLKSTMNGALIPIVKAVILNVIYKRVVELSQQGHSNVEQDGRAQRILEPPGRFGEFG